MCTGNEQRLVDCPFISNHNCIHSEDAGVVCQGKAWIVYTSVLGLQIKLPLSDPSQVSTSIILVSLSHSHTYTFVLSGLQHRIGRAMHCTLHMVLHAFMHHFIYRTVTLTCFMHAEPVCSSENVLNFTMSLVSTVSGDIACLACLFDGASLQPDTVWFVGGQRIDNTEMFGQVNTNGTLILRRPPGFIGEVMLSCQRRGTTFNITIFGEAALQYFR